VGGCTSQVCWPRSLDTYIYLPRLGRVLRGMGKGGRRGLSARSLRVTHNRFLLLWIPRFLISHAFHLPSGLAQSAVLNSLSRGIFAVLRPGPFLSVAGAIIGGRISSINTLRSLLPCQLRVLTSARRYLLSSQNRRKVLIPTALANCKTASCM